MWNYVYNEVLMAPDFKREGKRLLLDSKLFWKLWLYFGMMKAHKRRLKQADKSKKVMKDYLDSGCEDWFEWKGKQNE